MKKRERSSARSIVGQSSGEAERLVVSRKIRSAWRRYQGFPIAWSAANVPATWRPSLSRPQPPVKLG